jgi:hypothetical protein
VASIVYYYGGHRQHYTQLFIRLFIALGRLLFLTTILMQVSLGLNLCQKIGKQVLFLTKTGK